MTHVVRVNIESGDRIGGIIGKRDSALARTCARATNVERGNSTIRCTDEAVIDVASVHVLSRNHPGRADVLGYGALPRARARARNVERSDSAVGCAHESVAYITRVNVTSLNRSRLIDAKGRGALAGACARTRGIEGGHSAVRSAQDSVRHIARVNGSCSDRSSGVEAEAGKNNGTLAGTCTCVWSIKGSDGAVRSAQETVSHIAGVNVTSRDRRQRVN